MKWLREKWVDLIFNSFVSIIGVLFMLWVTGIKESNASIESDIESLKQTKANTEYVDKENAKQDERIEIIRKENRDDHSKMIDMLTEIMKNQKK